MQALLWLLSRFAAIAFLRAGPQDLPAGHSLIPVSLGLYLLVDLIQALPRFDVPHMIMIAVLDALLLAAFVQLLLRSTRRVARLPQTLGALYGAGAFLGLFGVPLAWQLESVDPVTGTLPAGVMLLLFVYLGWNLVVMAHVLRHALDRGLGTGLAISLLYFLFSQLIMGAVFAGV